jgi:acyl-CoA dehydrogenase
MPDRSYLAWPFFDERHHALAGEVERFAARELADLDGDAAEVDATCRMLVRQLAEAGLLRHAVPAGYGGIHDHLDVRSLCLVRETLARFAGLADFAFAMQGLGSGAISLFGTEDQRRAWLPAVADGRKIAAFALSEREAGSDVAAIATTAEPDGAGFVLNGAKTWISNGGIADFYIVFARTGEAPAAKGLSAFIVDPGRRASRSPSASR